MVINAEVGWENKLENNVSFLQKVTVKTRVMRQAQIATSETRALSVGLLNSTSCGGVLAMFLSYAAIKQYIWTLLSEKRGGKSSFNRHTLPKVQQGCYNSIGEANQIEIR